MSKNEENIWYCKIGGVTPELMKGADGPMRNAVKDAFKRTTGVDAEFTFSGWGQSLTENERAVVDNKPCYINLEMSTKCLDNK